MLEQKGELQIKDLLLKLQVLTYGIIEERKKSQSYLQRIKEFEATLSKYEENKKIYSLDFYIKDFIETSLNGAYAYLPKNWIKIRILEDDKTHKLILNEKNVSLYLVGSSPVPHSYSRKIASSSGLSGGAIAGIVIACVVVLIVIGLLFVYFNKPSPKSMDSSAIQFYNSSLSVVN